jgi:SOS response regulatory protein OraA/RecX
VKTVTALRAAGRQRVAVELDGEPWRTLPVEAVVTAGLASGVELDRRRARDLARELRRLSALRTATAALRRRDRSALELRERLGDRGVAPAQRERTLASFASAGLVDDRRLARERAQALAARGSGDALIRDDLERRGVDREEIDAALAGLPSEAERAAAVVVRRGRGAKTARYLAARGFGEEAVALSVAADDAAALG